jgi:di/tricarboxylate transporter
MPELPISIASVNALVTLVILIGAIYGFISEKIPPDVTAMLALLALLLTGVLKPEDAFAGFSHPATVSVAAVLVLSAGIERTGAMTFIARRVLAPIGKSEWLLTAMIMAVIGALSAFINNTAAVAIFIPLVLEVCRRTGASPGRILMPMAHAATFGGMCTLIGTSTNLVAHEFARKSGLPGFSMFELGKIGLPMMIAGFTYILFIGRWFLPRNRADQTAPWEDSANYLSEIVVSADSPWIDREVRADSFKRDYEVELLELVREGKPIRLTEPWEGQTTSLINQRERFAAGDALWVRGPLKRVLALAAQEGLELHRPQELSKQTEQIDVAAIEDSGAAATPAETKETTLAEVVIMPNSPLIGRTIKNSRFANRFDAVVLALRRGSDLRNRPSTTPLRIGDLLVVEGEPEAIKAMAETPGFLVVGSLAPPEERPGKLIISVLTMVAVIASVALGWLPIVTAATAGSAVLMLTGCLRPREAYQAIDLSLIFLLAGSLALGTALEKTGMTKLLANSLAGLSGVTGPFVVLAGFFLISMLISEFMSNSGTVALLGPVAISSAMQMGINPMSLLAAVVFGASAAFAMPIGYQTSLMILGPGGYRIRDYVKMGIVLDLLLAALAVYLIPRFWPLTGN